VLIGLTYDLRTDYLAAGYSAEETAEFDGIATIDAIDAALRGCGHQTDRIGNGRQLVQRLASGDRWDLVFNIAEGLHGAAREAQVPAILDLYEIPYTFSDPLVMALCLHKGLTKTAVARAGVPTSPFALVETIEDVETVDLPYPLFAKPVAEGTGKGITAESKITDRDALRRVCRRLLERHPRAGAVPVGPGVHRRHPRRRRGSPCHWQHGDPAPADGRGRGLFL
jgi:D-alanine-D-alanine ligase